LEDTPLTDVPGWPDEHVEKLKDYWITTAQQVVALSATTRGLRTLAERLGVSEDEVQRLIDAAQATLAPEEQAAMGEAVDTSDSELGARRPREENRGTYDLSA